MKDGFWFGAGREWQRALYAVSWFCNVTYMTTSSKHHGALLVAISAILHAGLMSSAGSDAKLGRVTVTVKVSLRFAANDGLFDPTYCRNLGFSPGICHILESIKAPIKTNSPACC